MVSAPPSQLRHILQWQGVERRPGLEVWCVCAGCLWTSPTRCRRPRWRWMTWRPPTLPRFGHPFGRGRRWHSLAVGAPSPERCDWEEPPPPPGLEISMTIPDALFTEEEAAVTNSLTLDVGTVPPSPDPRPRLRSASDASGRGSCIACPLHGSRQRARRCPIRTQGRGR